MPLYHINKFERFQLNLFCHKTTEKLKIEYLEQNGSNFLSWVDRHKPFLATISEPYMKFMETWQPYSWPWRLARKNLLGTLRLQDS